MLESPPAIVMPGPAVPSDFSIDRVGWERTAGFLPRSGACATSTSEEIVVCGRRDDRRYRLDPGLPENSPLIDEISDDLSTRLGPLELGSLKQSDGSRRFGLRTRF